VVDGGVVVFADNVTADFLSSDECHYLCGIEWSAYDDIVQLEFLWFTFQTFQAGSFIVDEDLPKRSTNGMVKKSSADF
jgi:hypothetical protein